MQKQTLHLERPPQACNLQQEYPIILEKAANLRQERQKVLDAYVLRHLDARDPVVPDADVGGNVPVISVWQGRV
jgi:hypothetical protein